MERLPRGRSGERDLRPRPDERRRDGGARRGDPVIVGSMSTIPERRETFTQVFDCVVRRQTRPLDKLVVYLYGYDEVDCDLPRDPRVEYRLDSQRGPWVRYLTADEIDDRDVLVTFDDDTFYPE